MSGQGVPEPKSGIAGFCSATAENDADKRNIHVRARTKNRFIVFPPLGLCGSHSFIVLMNFI
jgi:hypothetical protein